jgi:hypothetical protein
VCDFLQACVVLDNRSLAGLSFLEVDSLFLSG